jgi:phosphate transport system substrate-binding protein
MKKLISSILILILLASLFGCADKSSENVPQIDISPPVTEADFETASPPVISAITEKPSEMPQEPEASQEQQEPEIIPFRFTRNNFPQLDGSTSMIPLGEAIACVLLGEPREDVRELINFSKTTSAFQNLVDISDKVSIVIASEPDWDSVDSGSGYAKSVIELMPIAIDSLVFIVNESNPVNDLTTEQVQKIYTGEITNWEQVGGDNIPIEAFQRNKDSGSQSLMDKLVMQGLELAPAPVEYMRGEMDSLISAVKSFDRTASAIGYTVYYYANEMKMAEGLKILSIDGVAPSDSTLASGEYPFINPYFAAIRKDAAPKSPERILFNWLISDEGRMLIKSEGYVPVGG